MRFGSEGSELVDPQGAKQRSSGLSVSGKEASFAFGDRSVIVAPDPDWVLPTSNDGRLVQRVMQADVPCTLVVAKTTEGCTLSRKSSKLKR